MGTFQMTDLLSSNLSAVCEDETAFGKLFSLPPESNLTMRDLQDTVCGVNLNITKLVSELEKSVPGFKDMLDAVSMLMIHRKVPKFSDARKLCCNVLVP